jgi:hypothetical protein
VGRKWKLEIIAVSEIYKEPASVYFVCEGQICQPRTVTVGQVVTERNVHVSPLFVGELVNDDCDDFCQLKFDEICFFIGNFF